jgi:hypothetical protein
MTPLSGSSKLTDSQLSPTRISDLAPGVLTTILSNWVNYCSLKVENLHLIYHLYLVN